MTDGERGKRESERDSERERETVSERERERERVRERERERETKKMKRKVFVGKNIDQSINVDILSPRDISIAQYR